MSTVVWPDVWRGAAARLDIYRADGLEALITEDVLRFAMVQELVSQGTSAARITAEWRRPGVSDSVDLVVSDEPAVAIEFKYPREPRETNAAWTQHLGEVLKDYYRLATMPGDIGQRWCVQLLSARMRRYLQGVNDRYGVRLLLEPGHVTDLDPQAVKGLPATARGVLSRWINDPPVVHARCIQSHRIGDDLLLVAHLVDPVVVTSYEVDS